MNAEERATRAVIALADIIIDTARESGPMGAPSGPLYAMLMGYVSLDVYQSILAALVRTGRVEVRNDCIHAMPPKAEMRGIFGAYKPELIDERTTAYGW